MGDGFRYQTAAGSVRFAHSVEHGSRFASRAGNLETLSEHAIGYAMTERCGRTSNLYRALHWLTPGAAVLSESEKWYQVALRIWGDALPLDEVSDRLGLEASLVGRRGEPLTNHPRSAKRRRHVWIHRFTGDSSIPFVDQLEATATRLEGVREALHALLSMPGIEADLSLGFGSGNGQGGDMLPASLLARIGALGLGLSLDLYPPDVDTATRHWLEDAT